MFRPGQAWRLRPLPRAVRPCAARLGVLALALLGSCRAPIAETPIFGIYPLWIARVGDEDRLAVDRFLDCLVHGSNLNQFWGNEARLRLHPSHALAPPAKQLEWNQLAEEWIAPQLAQPGGLPAPSSDETPVYLVFGGKPAFWTGACGRNAEVRLQGRRAGLGVVQTQPPCWATAVPLRSETQTAMHELVETVDRLLGHGACAAGGACRGRSICKDRCATFVGLTCPGAPT